MTVFSNSRYNSRVNIPNSCSFNKLFFWVPCMPGTTITVIVFKGFLIWGGTETATSSQVLNHLTWEHIARDYNGLGWINSVRFTGGDNMYVKALSRVWLFVTPWTVAYQAPPCMGFSRQKYWSGLPLPSPEDLPDQGSNLALPHCRQTLYCLSHQGPVVE